jgi:hypothetical protein
MAQVVERLPSKHRLSPPPINMYINKLTSSKIIAFKCVWDCGIRCALCSSSDWIPGKQTSFMNERKKKIDCLIF